MDKAPVLRLLAQVLEKIADPEREGGTNELSEILADLNSRTILSLRKSLALRRLIEYLEKNPEILEGIK